MPDIADALVALHSSDPVTVHLTAMARMVRASIGAVETALYTDRSVLRHHAMRRTLWVATPGTLRLAHAAVTRQIAATEHRRTLTLLGNSGIEDPAGWLAAAKRDVRALLASHGPLGARELGRQVPALRHPLVLSPGTAYSATVGAHTRILLLLGFEGAIVRTRPSGTWINAEYTWAAAESWLPGGLDGPEERPAAAALVEQWLRRFGPATTADLAWWTGWPGTKARRALADVDAVEVAVDAGPAWVAPGDEQPVEEAGQWIALLPSLDPTTMGWQGRDWYLPPEAAEAFDTNGNAGPTIWVDGQVVGAWAQRGDGTIALHWFRDVPRVRQGEVAKRAEQMREWVGDTRYSVRFPGRIHPRLLATSG